MRAFRPMFYTGTVVQLVSEAVHFFGMSRKHEPTGGQEKMLYDLMHTYFLTGFGLVYGVFVLFLGLINVFAIRQAGESRFLKSLCWLNVLCMAAVSAIAFKFFFLPPLLFAVVPLLTFLASALTAFRQA